MNVLLVWENDAVLGVFFDTPRGRRQAAACMRGVRKQFANEEWRKLPSGRWYQPNNSIARLEVETREVIP